MDLLSTGSTGWAVDGRCFGLGESDTSSFHNASRSASSSELVLSSSEEVSDSFFVFLGGGGVGCGDAGGPGADFGLVPIIVSPQLNSQRNSVLAGLRLRGGEKGNA